jgi:hypothetical protein
LEQANTRLWETTYAPAAGYAPWLTWHAWLIEYRELLVVTREMYDTHHGRHGTLWRR